MDLNELQQLIKTRRSIRQFQNKKIPEKLLLEALELATWAPNAGNQQNWRFYIIENQNTIRAIADAVQTSADRIASWPEASQYDETAMRWRKNASFFRSAPAAIAVATTKYQSLADKILEAREKAEPQVARIREARASAASNIQSVGAAVGYLMLILHQMGLGTCWMTGPIQAKKELEKIIGVPPEKDLVAFIPVGYPAEAPTKDRRPFKEVYEIIR